MIVNEINGDIVKILSEGHIIAHGCNCFHTMGAGVAGQLARKYPEIPLADKRQTTYADHSKLGSISAVWIADSGMCINMYTQYAPGPNVDYGAILNAFMGINRRLSVTSFRTAPVYIPKIGAGIAGGDWNIIEKIINIATPNVDIIVVNYESSK